MNLGIEPSMDGTKGAWQSNGERMHAIYDSDAFVMQWGDGRMIARVPYKDGDQFWRPKHLLYSQYVGACL